LFQTVVPRPFERLAAAARRDEAGTRRSAGRACASGVEREPSAPLGLVESSSLASLRGVMGISNTLPAPKSYTVRSKYTPATARLDKRVSR